MKVLTLHKAMSKRGIKFKVSKKMMTRVFKILFNTSPTLQTIMKSTIKAIGIKISEKGCYSYYYDEDSYNKTIAEEIVVY